MHQLKKLFGIGEAIGQLEENNIVKYDQTDPDGSKDSITAYDVIAKIAGLSPYGEGQYIDAKGTIFIRCPLGFKPEEQHNLGLKLQEEVRLKEHLEDKLIFAKTRMEYLDNKLVGLAQSKDKQIEVLNTENQGLKSQIKQLNQQLNYYKQTNTSIVKTLTKLYDNVGKLEKEKVSSQEPTEDSEQSKG